MTRKLSDVEKLAAFTLLLVLALAVFPMEQPGMLYPWLGIEPNILFTLSFAKFTVVELLLGGALTAAFLHRFSKPGARYNNRFSGIFWLILLCIVWGYLGSAIGGRVVGAENLGVAHWKRLVYGMALFVALTLFLDTKHKLKATAVLIVVATLLLDVYGLGRYLFFGGLKVQHYLGRVVFWETVKLSLNAFVIIYCLGALLLGRPEIGWREKRLYQLAIVAAYAVIFLSARRTSLIMTLIGSAAFIMILARRGKIGTVLAVTTAGLMLLVTVAIVNYEAVETKFISRFESLLGVFDSSVTIDQGSTQGHIQDLVKGWQTVMENPVWGVGFGWQERRGSLGTGTEEHLFWVHNSLLTFWMRFGLPGVITYFFLYYRIITVLWRAYRRNRDYLSAAFLIWFSVEFLSGLFFPPFFGYFKAVALFFGTLALANAHLNILAREHQPLLRTKARFALGESMGKNAATVRSA